MFKKRLAILLASLLVVSTAPTVVFAAENEGTDTPVVAATEPTTDWRDNPYDTGHCIVDNPIIDPDWTGATNPDGSPSVPVTEPSETDWRDNPYDTGHCIVSDPIVPDWTGVTNPDGSPRYDETEPQETNTDYCGYPPGDTPNTVPTEPLTNPDGTPYTEPQKETMYTTSPIEASTAPASSTPNESEPVTVTEPTAVTEPVTETAPQTTPAKPAVPKLSVTKKTLSAGAIYVLRAKIKNVTAAQLKKASFTSNKKTTAAVSSAGVITALKKGTANITVKVAGKKFTFTAVVKNNPTARINNKAVTSKSYSVKRKGVITVELAGKADAIANSYSTSDKKIAKVVSKTNATTVKIKAYKRGSAKITVKVNKVKTFVINVNVK